MIGEYINDINDPNVRKIEALLSSLNRKLWLEQIGDLRNTTIIDFFIPHNYLLQSMCYIFLMIFAIFSRFLESTFYQTSISP
jgi:hypothetical protein